MKKWNLVLLCVVCLFVCAAIGCSNKAKVSGKVTFSDGTPATGGSVRLQGEKIFAKGSIDSKGSYSVGETKEGEGVTPGKYKVALIVPGADQKTFDHTRSGIELEVPAGGLKKDFTVEKAEAE
ncbi:MAG: hypothetical protein ACRC10_08690 [Thermoguttaceae bacterium]